MKIFPAEIVDVLTGHPAVADAAVVGLPLPREGAAPIAAVVLRATTTERDLQQFCEARLGRIKTPLRIVPVGRIERSATGKVQAEALRRLILDRLGIAGDVGLPAEPPS
ncbi:MAG: hypothetical protein AB7P02_17005 [Alphaproteobacteria bacterium]